VTDKVSYALPFDRNRACTSAGRSAITTWILRDVGFAFLWRIRPATGLLPSMSLSFSVLWLIRSASRTSLYPTNLDHSIESSGTAAALAVASVAASSSRCRSRRWRSTLYTSRSMAFISRARSGISKERSRSRILLSSRFRRARARSSGSLSQSCPLTPLGVGWSVGQKHGPRLRGGADSFLRIDLAGKDSLRPSCRSFV